MPIPKSVTKVSRDGNVTYTSNVDRVKYTIQELTRGALRDVGKYLAKQYKLNYVKNTKNKITGLGRKQVKYWARRIECDLQIGLGYIKGHRNYSKTKGSWAEDMEIGSSQRPKKSILRNTVFDNIDKIVEIESKYLSELSKEEPNLNGLSEADYEGD